MHLRRRLLPMHRRHFIQAVLVDQIKESRPRNSAAKTVTPSLSDFLSSRADSMFASAVKVYDQLCATKEKSPGANRDKLLVEGLRLLEQVFELDFEVVKTMQYGAQGARSLANVTCMRPLGGRHKDSVDTGQFIMNDELLEMQLEPGRLCEGGACCNACSRVHLPNLATAAECKEMMSRSNDILPPEPLESERPIRKQHNLQLQFSAAAGDVKLHLLYIRLVERIRRTISYEYGVPLPEIGE
jgi:hypothetical protein